MKIINNIVAACVMAACVMMIPGISDSKISKISKVDALQFGFLFWLASNVIYTNSPKNED